MPENEGKPVRDIRFAKKKPPRSERPFALAGPPPQPFKTGGEKGSRRAVFFIAWILLAAGLFWGGTIVADHLHTSRAAPQAARNSFDFGSWVETLKRQFAAYGVLADVSGGVVRTLATADEARKVLPQFLNGEHTGLLALLQSLKQEVGDLGGAAQKLVAARPDLRDAFPFFGNYLTFQTHLGRGEEALQGIIAWLQNPSPHHLIVLLGNTSELRPGGGFIGSFADITVANGTVSDVAVHDVNEADRTRTKNVVPPEPLQAITARWRIADANWFFDYPSSAKKVLQFMQESGLYASTTLDGVIALTPKVFEDTLLLTGPITLPDGTTVTSENVVPLIQSDVQAGQATGAAAPKAVLAELAPELIKRITALPDEAQKELFSKSLAWVHAKDAMLYFKDEHLANVLGAYEADGSLYIMPQNFIGDYFAAVDANVGGGKSDFVMEEHATLESHIDDRGVVHDTASIVRIHHGDTRSEWWYKTDNWNYLMLFTPPGATLEGVRGVGQRFITPKANYRSGWGRDPDVAAIEGTLASLSDGKLQDFKESGRNVFATWQKISAGSMKETVIEYSRNLPYTPQDGMGYDVVFEKQAGSRMSFHLRLTAPVGFTWDDHGVLNPVYDYVSEAPPGRFVIHLMLRKR
jgi:hypothetical protein